MKRATSSLSAIVLLGLLGACTSPEPAPEFEPEDVHAQIQYDAAIAPDVDFHPARIIVGFDGPELPTSLMAPGGKRLQRLGRIGARDAALYEVPDGEDVVAMVERLRDTDDYLYVEPDYVLTASASVNDPYRSYQWHFDAVNAETAWDYSTGSGVVVAVVDTGSSSGPNDGLNAVSGGYDFVNNDSDASDDQGHGSHVAGTIAQATNNGAGVAGLAFGATIMPVKVLNSNGSGYTSDIISGVDYAVANGASVINMSLGGGGYSSSFATAVADAYTAGVFVACATGNSYANSVDYPAAYAGAVGVGATRYGNSHASYSNTGSAVDLVAPGGDTSYDDNGDGYADGVLQETLSGSSWGYYFFDGTSMASPHVAAAAALLMANGATNVEAQQYLEDTATDLGSSGWDSTYGWGLIQADAALAAWDSGGGGGGGTGGTGGTANVAPTADAGGPYSATAGNGISFDGSGSSDSDGSIVSYSWNFGDGNSGSGVSPSHTYSAAGTYTVTLTVTDDGGDSDSDTAQSTISSSSCTINITRARWNKKKYRLSTHATSSDTSATLTVYADGVYVDTMSYKSSKSRYQDNTTLSSKPSTVTVESSCGGSDSTSL